MIRPPPKSQLLVTLVPTTTVCRSCECSGPFSSSCRCMARSFRDWPHFSRNHWPLIVPLLSFPIGPIVGTTGNRSPPCRSCCPPPPCIQSCGRSEEHTSELQSLMHISYSVLCLKTITSIPTNN